MESSAPAETQTQTFGPYEITHLVGRGGMASVYRALKKGPLGFAKEVALKLIKPELVAGDKEIKAFINEARIGGQLRHPNIVEIYEFNRVGKQFFLAMEFVDGWTLDTVVRLSEEVDHPLPADILLSVVEQVCRGLHYAHELEGLDGKTLLLVHRDIKPSNIILGRRGTVKVMDFGIAKSEANLFKTTTADMTKGTPFYMSPEQVRGGELGATSDIFSLGAVIYELCTGEVLYKADNLATVLYRVVKGEIPEGAVEAIEARVPGLGAIFERCSQAEAADRYPSTGALADALAELREGLDAPVDLAGYLYDLRFKLTGQDAEKASEAKGETEPQFAAMSSTMSMAFVPGEQEDLFELANAFIGEMGPDTLAPPDSGSFAPATLGGGTASTFSSGTFGPPTAGPETEDAAPHLRVPARGENLASQGQESQAMTMPMMSTQLSTQEELRAQARQPWLVWCAVAGLLAAVGYVGWSSQQSPVAPVAVAPAASSSGSGSSSAVSSTPLSVATPPVTQPESVASPPTSGGSVQAAAPSTPSVAVRPPRQPDPVPEPEPEPEPVGPPGELGVKRSAPNWGWIEIDGRDLRQRTPMRYTEMAPGTYQVRIIDGMDPSRSCSAAFTVTSETRTQVSKCNFDTGNFE